MIGPTIQSRLKPRWKRTLWHWKKEVAPTDFKIDRSDQFFFGAGCGGGGATNFFGGRGWGSIFFGNCRVADRSFLENLVQLIRIFSGISGS